jgi:hypothetical protein
MLTGGCRWLQMGGGQCVVETVVDEVAVASDAGGEGHELRDTGVEAHDSHRRPPVASCRPLTRNTWRSCSLSRYAP